MDTSSQRTVNTETSSISKMITTLSGGMTTVPSGDSTTLDQISSISTAKSTRTTVSTVSTTLSSTTTSTSLPASTTTMASTTLASGTTPTTSIPLSTTTESSGINMTILISAGAAAGTVLLVIIIVLLCICCRCCKNRAQRKRKERQFSDLPQPQGERPDPVGQSMDRKNIERTNNKVNKEPVYKVDDPSDYQYKPYIVSNDSDFNNPRYNTTPNNRKDSFGPPPPSHPSTLSIPRPSVKPARPADNRQPVQKQHSREESHRVDRSVYNTQIPMTGQYQVQQSDTQHVARHHSNSDSSKHTENYDSSLLRNKGDKHVNEVPKDRRYVQRSQQNKSYISPQREKSGKYENTITPYDGSTYNISGDFTKVVEPIAQSNTMNTVPVSPMHVEKHHSPTRTNPPEVLPKPSKAKEDVTIKTQNNIPKKKQVRKVPPENDQKDSGGLNELSNNPVFNKRKNLIDEKCKTIRLQVDDTNDIFVKDNIDNPEDEDPYWKIRESKLALMNMIPQSKNRVESTASMDYDDVVPNTNKLQSSDEEYEDTEINTRRSTGDYVNIPGDIRNRNDDQIYVNSNGIESDDQNYENVENDDLSDTAMRRLPSMRASMPPDVLSNAVDQLFDDALAGSELNLSIAPPAPTPSGNNQRAPVLKRKTKIEESKSEEHTDRDSWRISRSSFFDEIGADEPNAQLGQWDKEDYINAAMVKKGMALRDVNKPFNYMATH